MGVQPPGFSAPQRVEKIASMQGNTPTKALLDVVTGCLENTTDHSYGSLPFRVNRPQSDSPKALGLIQWIDPSP